MFVEINPNPLRRTVGDCVVRALCIATDSDWDTVMLELTIISLLVKDMQNSNDVWGMYLRNHGFTRDFIPNTCPDCYTIKDFAYDHPQGTYVVGTGTHAVCIKDGHYYDTANSGDEVPAYVWKKED